MTFTSPHQQKIIERSPIFFISAEQDFVLASPTGEAPGFTGKYCTVNTKLTFMKRGTVREKKNVKYSRTKLGGWDPTQGL